jgi:hypothetical protein
MMKNFSLALKYRPAPLEYTRAFRGEKCIQLKLSVELWDGLICLAARYDLKPYFIDEELRKTGAYEYLYGQPDQNGFRSIVNC